MFRETLNNPTGGSLLACEDFGRTFDHSVAACAFFGVFCLKWRLARAHKFHSFGQDQSTVSQQRVNQISQTEHKPFVGVRVRQHTK